MSLLRPSKALIMTSSLREPLSITTDVLVVGGGMAGAWAASAAAEAGAKVILVDKGCCGTSGVTAGAGTLVGSFRSARSAHDSCPQPYRGRTWAR